MTDSKAPKAAKTTADANYEMVMQGLTTAVNVRKFETALTGTGVTPARFLRQCQTVMNAVPALAKCDPYSVLGAMLGAAQMGLELEPALEECDIIPYAGEAKLMPRYGGLMKLVRQGEVTEIYADTVRERDHYVEDRGTTRRIEHVVDYHLSDEERGAIVRFYAVAKLARGGVEFTSMHVRDVEKLMNVVKAKTSPERWQYSPWNNHFGPMGEKTVLRKLCKRLPKTDRAARAMQLQAMAEAGEPVTLDVNAEVRDAAAPIPEGRAPASKLDGLTAALKDKNATPEFSAEESRKMDAEIAASAAEGR